MFKYQMQRLTEWCLTCSLPIRSGNKVDWTYKTGRHISTKSGTYLHKQTRSHKCRYVQHFKEC